MVRHALLVLSIGVALAFPDVSSVSKTSSQHSSHSPLISTPLGDVRGSTLTSRLGKVIFAFRGIRYAKAPENELRFQPPVPVEKWEGAYNATQDGASCPQPNVEPVSEDCLFLNVYTTKLPKGNETPKRPVIVFLHHGGFHGQSGKSSILGPQYMLDQEVVLVVPNYRLGVLGFLSTGDKEAHGNYGLKDQVQALKWIKENVASFGGDSESITLAGYGSGSVSVLLHLVSPLSKGLFHKVIAMSGSNYGNKHIPSNQLDLAKKLAKLLNCPHDTSANVVKCLKSKTSKELTDFVEEFKEFGDEPTSFWSPVIESDFGQTRFLTAHPVELIISGEFEKVPVLTGITSDEFGGRAYSIISNESLLNKFDKDFEEVAPIVFMYERGSDQSKTVSKAIKAFYFGDKSIDSSSLPALAQLYSDGIVGFNVNRAVKVIASKNSAAVYYYNFNYKGRYSFFYLPDSNNTVPYGVSHHDDLIYLFYISSKFPIFKENNPVSTTVEKMTMMWANFAKKGKPICDEVENLDNANWEPFTESSEKYMDIGNKLVQMEKLFPKRYAEWEKLYPLSNYENNAKHG